MGKSYWRLVMIGIISSVCVWSPWGGVQAAAEYSSATENQELNDQIAKVHEVLTDLDQQIAQHRQAMTQEADEGRKATLSRELDGLRRGQQKLERVLHDLVEEGRTTEWTEVDAMLKRVRAREQAQERDDQRQEALRDRQR